MLVIRRAQGSPRDVARVSGLLAAAGEAVGSALGAALRDDRWGLVLLAELRGEPEGFAVVRFVAPIGAGPGDAPCRAVLDRVQAAAAEVREALILAARAEAEARELPWGEVGDSRVARESPAPQGDRHVVEGLRLGSASLGFAPEAPATPMVTRWNGALAFRARWASDCARGGWSVEGCVGATEGEGDALRFDPVSRALREVHLERPRSVVGDPEVLARVRALRARSGRLCLDEPTQVCAMPATELALFDVSLDVFAALRSGALGGELSALAVTESLALLFVDGDYAGWRVLDPIAHVRPMGWPDVEPGGSPSQREALAALVHDWMVIDGSERPRPDEVTDPEEIAHMVALRARARALAAQISHPTDPTPGLARDIGAHVHWSWGFFRVPE